MGALHFWGHVESFETKLPLRLLRPHFPLRNKILFNFSFFSIQNFAWFAVPGRRFFWLVFHPVYCRESCQYWNRRKLAKYFLLARNQLKKNISKKSFTWAWTYRVPFLFWIVVQLHSIALRRCLTFYRTITPDIRWHQLTELKRWSLQSIAFKSPQRIPRNRSHPLRQHFSC